MSARQDATTLWRQVTDVFQGMVNRLVQRRVVVAATGGALEVRSTDPESTGVMVIPQAGGLNANPGDHVLTLAVHGRETAIANLSPSSPGTPLLPVRGFVGSDSTPNNATWVTVVTIDTPLAEGTWGLYLTGSGHVKRSVDSGAIDIRIGNSTGTNATFISSANNGSLTAIAHAFNHSRQSSVVVPTGGATETVTLQYKGAATLGTTYIYNALLTGFWYRIS